MVWFFSVDCNLGVLVRFFLCIELLKSTRWCPHMCSERRRVALLRRRTRLGRCRGAMPQGWRPLGVAPLARGGRPCAPAGRLPRRQRGLLLDWRQRPRREGVCLRLHVCDASHICDEVCPLYCAALIAYPIRYMLYTLFSYNQFLCVGGRGRGVNSDIFIYHVCGCHWTV